MNTTTTEMDLTETTRIANLPMRDLVYGPAPRRVRLPLRVIFVAAFLGATVGCATAPRPVTVEPETVGTLSASYHGIASAPVHATTDFGTPQVVDTDEDAPGPVVVSAPVEKVEAPEIAPKTDGVTTGAVR